MEWVPSRCCRHLEFSFTHILNKLRGHSRTTGLSPGGRARLYTDLDSGFAVSHLSTSLVEIKFSVCDARLKWGVRKHCPSGVPLERTSSTSVNITSSSPPSLLVWIWQSRLIRLECFNKIWPIVSYRSSHLVWQTKLWLNLFNFTFILLQATAAFSLWKLLGLIQWAVIPKKLLLWQVQMSAGVDTYLKLSNVFFSSVSILT